LVPRAPLPGELFAPPAKPSLIFTNFGDYLTDFEESEILNYRAVYYVRQSPVANKKASTKIPDFFRFVKGDHIAYRYEQVRVLGKGSFGSVLECVDHKQNESVAIKMLRDKPRLHSTIVFELNLLRDLQGENNHVIKFLENFSFRSFFCIVMELVSIDLYTALRAQRFVGFRLSVVQIVARECAIALKFVHEHNVIHGDIKPENILFTDSQRESVKIIDFGCSCFVSKLLFSYIQSRYYRAPEVILGLQYGTAIDIWSLGCVLCEMVTGQPLFPAEDESELIQMMAELIGEPPRPLVTGAPRAHHDFSPQGEIILKSNSKGKYHMAGTSSIAGAIRAPDPLFVDLIQGCLRWSPDERFTADDILQHEWVNRQLAVEIHMPQSARVSTRRFE
jgi:dual specificity tyrosine-phosphorylation-regulated kinase 2/3/4